MMKKYSHKTATKSEATSVNEYNVQVRKIDVKIPISY